MPQLKVEVTSANVKKLDLKAYGIDSGFKCYATVTVGEQTFSTKKEFGLDPVFEQEFEFEFATDPADTKFNAAFFMGQEGAEKQIGDTIDFLLPALNKGKPTYKCLIVPGGKVEMLATAVDFGKEADAGGEDVLGALGALDDDDMGMMESDDEDEE